MIAAFGRVAAAAVVMLAAPAFAQDDARERELATTYVIAGDGDDAVIDPELVDKMERDLVTTYADIPEETKAWMRRSFRVAEKQVAAEFDDTIQSRLVDAFVKRFTEAELEDLVAKQAFLRQPKLVAAIEASRNLPAASAIDLVRKALTAEEFDGFIKTTTSPLIRAAAALTVSEAKAMLTDYLSAFDKALYAQCGDAPKGVHLCEHGPQPR